jgi:hypothetical protein
MSEIDRGDLWNLFVGTKKKKGNLRQTIVGHFRQEGDYIKFHVYYPGDANTTATTLRHSIKESDLDDIVDIFNDVSLSSVPPVDYLLWILWVREEKFGIRVPLKKSTDFVQRAFAMNNRRKTSAETVNETFDILLREGYLEDDSEDWQVSSGAYFLTSKGKRFARRMYEKMKRDIIARDEPGKSAKKKTTRNKRSKYEVAVKNFLLSTAEAVQKGELPQDRIANLNPTVIAEALIGSEGFKKAEITSIKDKVRRCKAWKNRFDILPIDGIKPPRVEEVYEEWKDADTGHLDGLSKVDCSGEEYEAPVEEYLRALHNDCLCERITHETYCARARKLSPKDIAKWINQNKTTFKTRSIVTIENGVRRSQTWINREEILNTDAYRK